MEMLTVVGKGARVAWFVERRVWFGWWKGGWSEAVVESDVGGGGGCYEAVDPNNDSKRKMATSKITAWLTRIIPLKHWWGILSEHRLSDITDLGTFMVFCEFPQP